jgi:hypothetical protein
MKSGGCRSFLRKETEQNERERKELAGIKLAKRTQKKQPHK